MLIKALLLTAAVAMVPVIELRGAIPIGMANGLPFWPAFLAGVVGNLIPVPFLILFVRKVFAFLKKKSKRLSAFVEKLEKGIDTQVLEGGNRFSEGQKQRLSIARALLLRTPVLLLDEATSALDMATERRVLKNILRRDPLQTIIVTAHRPSVLSLCHRVYKVQNGRFDEVNDVEIQEFLQGD